MDGESDASKTEKQTRDEQSKCKHNVDILLKKNKKKMRISFPLHVNANARPILEMLAGQKKK